MALAPTQFSSPMPLLGHASPFDHHHSIHHIHHHLSPIISSPTQTTSSPTSALQQQQQQQVSSQGNSNGRWQRRVTLVHKPSPSSPTLPETEVAAVSRQKKTVRFCDNLEQVRLFLKTQKPCAVREGDPSSIPLELKTPNWPPKTVLRSNRNNGNSMIRMESVHMETNGPEGIVLTGRCKVANLSFHKHVVVRYTTDYWKSFHEIEALYREPIGASANTWDRFTFEITIDQPCTLYLALRYNVNDKEFWDNNDGLNYQVDVVESSLIVPEPIHPAHTPTTPVAATKFKQEEEPEDEPFRTREPREAQPPQPQQRQKQPRASCASANTMPTSSSQRKKKLGSRYDFGASLSEVKKYEPSYPFLMMSAAMGSSPSPSPTATDEDIQARYHDLISKYCFYGNAATTSTEPICG